jgi:hypothetical protein
MLLLMDDTTSSLISDDSHNPFAKTHTRIKSSTPVFILCDRCYWCATYFGNTKIPLIINVHYAMQTAMN